MARVGEESGLGAVELGKGLGAAALGFVGAGGGPAGSDQADEEGE
jgi:hypothetical protein